MDLHAIHAPALYIYLLPLQTTLQNKIKFNRKRGKKRGEKQISCTLLCDTVSHTDSSLIHVIFTFMCSLQRFTCLVQVLWFLLHYWCWALTGIIFVYGALALCCGDPTALGLEDWSLYMILRITYVIDVGMGQHITLSLALSSSSGWSAYQLSLVLTYQGELSCGVPES